MTRINIHDKDIRHSLDLTSEELVSLIRYKKPPSQQIPSQIVSPVIVICEDKKFQADIIEIRDAAYSNQSYYNSPEDDPYITTVEDFEAWQVKSGSKKKKDPTENIPPFILSLELTPAMFEGLLTVNEVLVLLRVQNIPSYIKTNKVKVDYNKEDPKEKPQLVIKVEKVRPIVDLLKAQISEAAFYDVFINGRSDEFFDKGGEELDDIVGLIGIRRRSEESDIALRMRVKDYLRIRMESLSKVKEDDLQGLVKETEEQEEIERKLNEEDEKRKKDKE